MKLHALSKNITWNVLGTVSPFLAAVWSIPVLVGNLGEARFGILALIWVVIGYFNIFDLGLGRATTKFIAGQPSLLGSGSAEIVSTSFVLSVVFGTLLAVVILTAALTFPVEIAAKSGVNAAEIAAAIILLGLVIPATVSSTVLVGALEALGRFKELNLVRLVLGLSIFLIPAVLSFYTTNLAAIVAGLAAARVWGWIGYFREIRRHLGIRLTHYSSGTAKDLLSMGGWLTLSVFISSALLYADRFFIAGQLNMEAVAHYSVPYELVTRLIVIPAAVGSATYPWLVRLIAQRSPDLREAYDWSSRVLGYTLMPFVAALVLLPNELIGLWVGQSFVTGEVVAITKILAVGLFFNAMTRAPAALLEGIGRPDVIPKCHVFELPLYVAGLYLLLNSYGLLGAAVAWMLRIFLDASLAHYLSAKKLTTTGRVAAVVNAEAVLFIAVLVAVSQWGSLVSRAGLAGLSFIYFGYRFYVLFFDVNTRYRFLHRPDNLLVSPAP